MLKGPIRNRECLLIDEEILEKMHVILLQLEKATFDVMTTAICFPFLTLMFICF